MMKINITCENTRRWGRRQNTGNATGAQVTFCDAERAWTGRGNEAWTTLTTGGCDAWASGATRDQAVWTTGAWKNWITWAKTGTG